MQLLKFQGWKWFLSRREHFLLGQITLLLSKEYYVLSSEAFIRDTCQIKVKQEAGIQDGDSHVFQGQRSSCCCSVFKDAK